MINHSARWYSEHAEYSKISLEEKELRDKIVAVFKDFVVEMEGYSYFGSNPGIPEDHIEDAVDYILINFCVKELEKDSA